MLAQWPLGEKPLLHDSSLSTESLAQVPSGPRRVWPFDPAWPPSGESVEVSYTFRTEILVSRSGKEKRLSRRSTPRKEIDQRAMLFGDRLREYKDLLWYWQHRNWVMPEITRSVTLPVTAPAGTQSIYLDDPPLWMRTGNVVVIGSGPDREELLVGGVEGNVTHFVGATTREWAAGDRLCPGLTGTLNTRVSADRNTTEVAAAEVNFRVLPLSEIPRTPEPVATTFNDREVFLGKPNWADPVDSTLGHDVDELDYGSGSLYRFIAVAHGLELTAATYLSRNRTEADALLDLFLRMRGQQGEFYMPTWENDFQVKGLSAQGTSTLRVAGRRVAEQYVGSTVHKALFVQMADGSVLLRRVLGLAVVADDQGDDTLLQVDSPWPTTLSESNVVISGWLLVRRFASDRLTIEWLTDQVANTQLNLMTLEDLTPE